MFNFNDLFFCYCFARGTGNRLGPRKVLASNSISTFIKFYGVLNAEVALYKNKYLYR